MSASLKSRLAAAEMRHEMEMRRKGYVITRNGRSQWKNTGKPFRKQPAQWQLVATEACFLVMVCLVLVLMLSL